MNSQQKKPEILATRWLAQTNVFHVQEVDVSFSNGEQRVFERLHGPGRAVLMVPMLDKDTVLLVREYGVGIDSYYLSLPKGKIDKDETALEAANRELKEEIGYGAKSLQPLKSVSLSPAYMGKRMLMVLAQDLYEEKLVGDEPEPLEVVPWRLDNLAELFAREDFHEARSIAALYMVREILHG